MELKLIKWIRNVFVAVCFLDPALPEDVFTPAKSWAVENTMFWFGPDGKEVPVLTLVQVYGNFWTTLWMNVGCFLILMAAVLLKAAIAQSRSSKEDLV